MPLTKVNGQMLDGAITADSSGNVGIGATPSAWSAYKGLNIGLNTTLAGSTGGSVALLSTNAYFDGSSYKYITTDAATQYQQNTGTHVWRTAASGTAGATLTFTDRMRIDANGNVLINASTVGLENGGIQFQPNGNITSVPFVGCSGNSSSGSYISYGLYSTSLSQYQFYVGYNGTIAARSTSITGLSDISEKENIQPLETGLNEVLALQPRRFDWKNGSGQNIAGFVAQEVETVLPDLVEEYKVDEQTTKRGLKMGDMIPTLVKAIQELKAELDATKAEVAELKAKGQ